jgi:hypothetical protein
MAKTFEELKLEGAKELARLQAATRLRLGSHKRTRLRRAGRGPHIPIKSTGDVTIGKVVGGRRPT